MSPHCILKFLGVSCLITGRHCHTWNQRLVGEVKVSKNDKKRAKEIEQKLFVLQEDATKAISGPKNWNPVSRNLLI